MIQLSKEETIKIYIAKVKKYHIRYRFTITSKIKWYCLSCLTPIYIGYTNTYVRNIFCNGCWGIKKHEQTQIQFQYLRVLKEKQIDIIEHGDYSNMLKLTDVQK